ncbi:hypothetical protein [Pseudoalteromonas sp. MMG022]|uniref:hypothetical protein n=1 Tax=Pseudoalteromonas sp. MMG022 TaxID=2909978 RepID=UPI001F354844|nr:hypothetical protein [Pseudoalteromonas sp. MMG022]MCF6436007.1 hypothetical protein [Pseudoalteromonas sp. MMG022]
MRVFALSKVAVTTALLMCGSINDAAVDNFIENDFDYKSASSYLMIGDGWIGFNSASAGLCTNTDQHKCTARPPEPPEDPIFQPPERIGEPEDPRPPSGGGGGGGGGSGGDNSGGKEPLPISSDDLEMLGDAAATAIAIKAEIHKLLSKNLLSPEGRKKAKRLLELMDALNDKSNLFLAAINSGSQTLAHIYQKQYSKAAAEVLAGLAGIPIGIVATRVAGPLGPLITLKATSEIESAAEAYFDHMIDYYDRSEWYDQVEIDRSLRCMYQVMNPDCRNSRIP